MRTRALVSLLGLAAVSAASAVAQGYTVNATGYYTLVLPPGFTLIANQLNAMTNTVAMVLADQLPDGAVLYKLDPVTAQYSANRYNRYDPSQPGNWDDPSQNLNPGEGAFLWIPGPSSVKLIILGELSQGTLTLALPQGLSLASSIVPQTDILTADGVHTNGVHGGLAFPAADGDMIYRFHDATDIFGDPLHRRLTSQYSIHQWIGPNPGGQWDDPPIIGVGEGFIVLKREAVAWVRTFSVNG